MSYIFVFFSLKILKEWSEAVNQRTENIIPQEKWQKDNQWYTKHYTEN